MYYSTQHDFSRTIISGAVPAISCKCSLRLIDPIFEQPQLFSAHHQHDLS
uniref:Uncharacterized protein n=1 Tax=Arion vulgaris TaxID=1028688 RepID=A0A0B7BTI0_9EUPU